MNTTGKVDITRAFVAGVLGGLLMALAFAAARLAGLPVGVALVLGTELGGFRGTSPWFLGAAVHFLASGVFALAYAWVFEHVVHRSGWRWGTLLGLVHAAIAGLVLGAFPAVASGGRTVPSPGWFMANLGPGGVAIEILAHLVYGATVGVVYRYAR